MNVYEALMRDGKERRERFEAAKAADDELTHAALVGAAHGARHLGSGRGIRSGGRFDAGHGRQRGSKKAIRAG